MRIVHMLRLAAQSQKEGVYDDRLSMIVEQTMANALYSDAEAAQECGEEGGRISQ